MTSKGEQAKNQLIAAAIAQFGEYGQHATTRDIAAQAGQNIAAITYYFGSKDDLYLACAQWIADFIGDNFRPQAEAAEHLLAGEAPDGQAGRDRRLRAGHNLDLLEDPDAAGYVTKKN
ncbi:TetR family transcriptional regulator, partial [Klebsiella pneumoniae]|uniref:TetR family transcriptional regulator n=1 Tax=Klebsiella pneumoniae TaxID=573 RepID=UPI0025B36E2D